MVWLTEVDKTQFTPYAKGYALNAKPLSEVAGFNFYDIEFADNVEADWAETGITLPYTDKIIAYATWRYLQKSQGIRIVTPAMVAVDPEYRGSKYSFAVRMYEIALNAGYIIQAGDIKNVQSKGGASIWKKMIKMENVEIWGQSHPFKIPVKLESSTMSCLESYIWDSDYRLFMKKAGH